MEMVSDSTLSCFTSSPALRYIHSVLQATPRYICAQAGFVSMHDSCYLDTTVRYICRSRRGEFMVLLT